MKALLTYLRGFLKKDFSAGLYLSVFTFLMIVVTLYYSLGWEEILVDSQPRDLSRFPIFLGIYATPLVVSCGLIYVFKKEKFVFDIRFWLTALALLSFLALDRSWFFQDYFFKHGDHETRKFVGKNVSALKSLFTIVFPIVVFYYLRDRKEGHRYGLQTKGFKVKPYVMMLFVMIPLIYLASLTEDFTSYYPKYQRAHGLEAAEHWGVGEWVSALIYESTYAQDFLSVEMAFRGFLIMALCRYAGTNVVLISASVYCFYHFGKPVGETISSFFGGFVLGVFAYESKSIFGGVIIHVAVALLMEFFAYLAM